MDEVWRNHLASIRPDADLAEADWWDTTWDSATPAAVGFLIPRGFEAYARVLHPARSTWSAEPISWATVARESGTTMHPQAQFWRLARRDRPYGYQTGWAGDSLEGALSRPEFEALADVLGRHTATAEHTIVAFWVGYGFWPAAWHDVPTTRAPVRESYLFERPLADVPTLCAEASAGWWQSPSAWWPADHAWTTSADVDLDSTLVGGSRALVDELLADERLEVLPWPVEGSLWSDADTINNQGERT